MTKEKLTKQGFCRFLKFFIPLMVSWTYLMFNIDRVLNIDTFMATLFLGIIFGSFATDRYFNKWKYFRRVD